MTETQEAPKKRTPEPSSAEYKAMDKSVVEQLNEQKKVSVRLYQVPPSSSDRPLPDVEVAVNGHVYQIQRGHTVKVPETVAEILAEAGHI